MKEEEIEIILSVRNIVKDRPHLIPYIISAISDGAQEAIREYKEMAVDMEVLASVAIGMLGEKRVSAKAKQKFEELALSKLQKYDFKTFCRWDWAVKEKSDEE